MSDALRVALRDAAARLADAGVISPRVDAELLAAHVLGWSRGELAAAALAGRAVPPDRLERLAALVDQRADRVPLQHLTGLAPFRSLELRVGPGVFVPRPETEQVAEPAVRAAAELGAAELAGSGPGAGALVVDLCTGSGALALAVAVEVPTARVIALELDPQALAWAAENVARLAPGRVDLRAGDVAGADRGVLADVAGSVDVVVSNPPYIPDGARPTEPEVADHDPELALYGGGEDGLATPRAVVATALGLLRPGGLLVMEHAEGQGAATRRLASGPEWGPAVTLPDLTGRDRALVVRRAGR